MPAAKQQQRKFRNVDERRRIVDETLASLAQMGLAEQTSASLANFTRVLSEFACAGENGRSFDGVVELSELGAAIEYSLPGRRVQKHFARLVKSKVPVPAATDAPATTDATPEAVPILTADPTPPAAVAAIL